MASRSAIACSSGLPGGDTWASAAAVSSTAVFSVSVANCSRCASCTDSAWRAANSCRLRMRSSGSPPNGKPKLPSMPAIVPPRLVSMSTARAELRRPGVVTLPTATRGLVWSLGLGAFGLAFSITTTAAYLPPVLQQFTGSTTLIALVLAAEGAFAITLPLVIGPWSDTFHTPLGRRRPFMLAALGPIGFCLALMAFMPNLWTMALLVFAFFFAYYVYEPPYRGLYPDLLPASVYGRAQGIQHIMRGVALGLALVGGGFLFHVWNAAPFLVAAFATTLACGAAIVLVREDVAGTRRAFEGVRSYLSR